MVKARKRKLPFGWIIGAMTAVSVAFFGMLYYTTRVETGVPKVEITLNDYTTLETINAGEKTTKYYDNLMTLTDGLEAQEFADVEIKGRGNTTWGQLKKPYQIKLAGKADLLGLGKARKWVLLADYLDASHLRNDMAFWVEWRLDEEYALDGEFVELTVDGIYYGLYYLTHKVNIGKYEVDLRDQLGIVVEMDNLSRHLDAGGYTHDGDFLAIKDVVNEDLAGEAFESFLSTYNRAEWAAENGNWVELQKYMDVESFAKYYVLTEFMNNPDAYSTSFFMYKDGEGDRVHAGPGWDFDLAAGNYNWVWAYTDDLYEPTAFQIIMKYALGGEHVNSKTGEVVKLVADSTPTKLFINLVKMPEFRELVVEIWQEKMARRKEELLAYLEAQAEYIREAALRDEARWKKTGFDSEVEYLLNWVERRYEFLDGVFAPGVDWSNRDEIIYPEKSKEARPEVPTTEVEDAENDANGARNKVPVTEVNDYSKNNPA